jgi:hypothetical protein
MQIMQIQNIYLESTFGLVLNFQPTRGLTFKMREDAIYAIWLATVYKHGTMEQRSKSRKISL